MANTGINLVDLDFDGLKNGLKQYLKSQEVFKDYDFEGSNINVLLDVLSYNTYMNAFYLNMVASEMFIDSAQLRESVVSRAKELNYTPRSFRSARAVVDIGVQTDGSVATIVMPKGTTFSTRIGSNNYTFSTNENIVLSGLDNEKTSNNVTIYEGFYVNDTFTYRFTDTTQRFILSNPTIDTDSISVTVIENNGSDVLTFTRATSLFDKQSNSQIFFLQAAENDKYEVVFGDGVIGRKPKDNALIVCDYRITKGELPNGAFKFKSDGSIGGFSNVNISTTTAAYGGAIGESVESIRYNAPRYFATQERAVTAEDYKNLLILNFPEINALSVYGGEEEDPPQYGKVFLAVDLKNIDGIPEYKKQQFYRFIKSRSSLSIDPVFVNPDFMYVEVSTTVRYNINITALNNESIKQIVLDTIKGYNATYLDDFDTTLRYSNFIRAIDGADRSILSNDTVLRPIKLLSPELNISRNYDVHFNQELENNFSELGTTHPIDYISCIESTKFVVGNNIVSFEDDGNGALNLITTDGSTHNIIRNVGTIDYKTGKLQISRLNITEYTGSGIKIYARTKRKDVSSMLRTILTIKDEDIKINVIQERE